DDEQRGRRELARREPCAGVEHEPRAAGEDAREMPRVHRAELPEQAAAPRCDPGAGRIWTYGVRATAGFSRPAVSWLTRTRSVGGAGGKHLVHQTKGAPR